MLVSQTLFSLFQHQSGKYYDDDDKNNNKHNN